MTERFSPEDEVPRSGIYKVVHHPGHTEDHEVTCIGGRKFPPCILAEKMIHSQGQQSCCQEQNIPPCLGHS
jgi:hypothetical protein